MSGLRKDCNTMDGERLKSGCKWLISRSIAVIAKVGVTTVAAAEQIALVAPVITTGERVLIVPGVTTAETGVAYTIVVTEHSDFANSSNLVFATSVSSLAVA
ncbi:hypothetical protein Tco_1250080 [Tanacetum coccineum]